MSRQRRASTLLRHQKPPAPARSAARFFLRLGATTVDELLDQAGARPGRIVAHAGNHPGGGCYGLAEVDQKIRRCRPRCWRFTATAAGASCDECGAAHPTIGPLVPLAPRPKKGRTP